jgi:hypothetical protein
MWNQIKPISYQILPEVNSFITVSITHLNRNLIQ